MGDIGLIFTPVLVRRLLVSLSLSGPMTGLIEPSNSPVESCNLLLAARLPPLFPFPSHSLTPYM